MISTMPLLSCSSLSSNYVLTTAIRETNHFDNNKVIRKMTITPQKKNLILRKATSPTASANAQKKDMANSKWPNYFLNSILEDEETIFQREQEVNALKQEVKKELLETIANKTILEQTKLINDIQHLGIGYHFETEIEEALNEIYKTHFSHEKDHDFDLFHASLIFRLLRQNAIYVSCDMFKKFLDKTGKFQTSLSGDVEGILCLYEASHLGTHGDDILDEALAFTTAELKIMVKKLAYPLAERVAHALDLPLHKGVPHIEARHWISFCEHDPCCNKMLLKFAKLNFNLLQSLHKKELLYLSRWCFEEGMDVYTALPCKVRELIAEIYYAAIGTIGGRLENSLGRMAYFKVTLVGTLIDDLCDECNIADLELLTEAIQRWDKDCESILPDNMKVVYTKLLDVFEEVEQELSKQGRAHAFNHALDAFKIVWPLRMQVQKWCREKYIPTFDEYIKTSGTSGYKFFTIIAWIGVAEISADKAFEWLKYYSKAIEALCSFYRLMDDLAEDYLNEANEVSVISCYMKQHNLMDKAKVRAELQKIIDNIWKDINYASLRPSTMPTAVMQCFVAQAQYLHVGFYRGDGFTFPDETPMEANFELLYKDPIPI